MRQLILISVLLPASTFAETIAFIGTPMSVAVSDRQCMDFMVEDSSGQVPVCMDRVFSLRYEVQEVLLDAHIETTIEFFGFYHYRGLPIYTSYDPALVILEQIDDSWVLSRLDAVEEMEGRWWVCTELSEDLSCLEGQFVDDILAGIETND